MDTCILFLFLTQVRSVSCAMEEDARSFVMFCNLRALKVGRKRMNELSIRHGKRKGEQRGSNQRNVTWHPRHFYEHDGQ